MTETITAHEKSYLAALVKIKQLEKERDLYREALNEIAVWNDGEEVSGCFDEPYSARVSREAIAEGDKIKGGE